jgi:hypothetical protein
LILKSLAAVAAFIALALPAPAGANIATVTYTGVVTSGGDTTGVFGAPNTDLTGDSYAARYVFNTSLGTQIHSPHQSLISGGLVTGDTDPALSVTLTINGVAVPIGVDYWSELAADHLANINDFLAYASHSIQTPTVFNYDYISNGFSHINLDPSASLPIEPDQPFFFQIGGDHASGYFHIMHIDEVTGAVEMAAAGNFHPQTYQVEVSFTPEPAAWMLMLGGFGGLGLALRRRTARLAV